MTFEGNKAMRPLYESVHVPPPIKDRPIVICLCGSTRFGEAFAEAQLRQTLEGKIVLTIGCNLRSDAELFSVMNEEERTTTKIRLDELHLRKIDIADEVMILDVDGYIGPSTRRELDYAQARGTRVLFWSSEMNRVYRR